MNNEPFTQATIREKIRQARHELSPSQQDNAAIRIAERLERHHNILIAKRISVYLAVDGEIGTHYLIQSLWRLGKDVYLPILHPFTPRQLLFQRYTKETPMLQNSFGLLQPKLDVTQVIATEKLDIIITPLVAFDAEKNRIGMGGGYYDRILANYSATSRYPIGVAHECQRITHVPIQPWDIVLAEIITPDNHYI